MLRFRVVAQIVAVVALLSLLLTACRVTEVPMTASPQANSYPSPRPRSATRTATAVKPTATPAASTPLPGSTATPAAAPGEVAFTLTILHSGEVAGEVVPCG